MLLLRHGQCGEPALSCLEAAAAALPEDVAALHALTTLRWVRDQRNPEGTQALAAARRLVTLVPGDAGALALLGMVALSAGRYRDSWRAFAAAGLEPHRRLAERLLHGEERVAFALDRATYDFGLAVHTTQAIESSIAHCAGTLTEIEELRHLKAVLGRAAVIVEVGVLLGNHAAFFLQQLAPRRLHLIEADPSMLPEIRRNAAANNRTGAQVFLHNAFAGVDGGEPLALSGVQVPQRSPSGLVAEPVDVLKVDVDGGELPFLAGAEGLILASRPFVMIETDAVTDAAVRDWFAARGYVLHHRIERGRHANSFFAPGRRGR